MAALPELDVARVQRWCRARVPDEHRDQMRVEVDVTDRHLTIVECRPPWDPAFDPEWTRRPIARLRYMKPTQLWTLYWSDRNSRFHAYDRAPASANLRDLLAEIADDPTCIFWG